MLLYGADRPDEIKKITGSMRLGLIASSASLGTDYVHILQKLNNVHALYAPEHGFRGDIAAGQTVEDYTDEFSGLPVYSLYSQTNKRFRAETLEGIDALVYDIPDVGCRYYTYISTLYYAMQACAQHGKTLIVLDRPDPLGGKITEGNMLDENYKSFVGICSIATRYGLTAGEFATFVNAEKQIGCNLKVVQCTGWKRGEMFTQSGQAWVPPSPNLPSFTSALCYPGSCLFEGTNLSEGRGTARPFEQTGAPYIKDPIKLANEMNKKNLPGVTFIPAWFSPTFSKHSGQVCKGVQWLVTNADTFRPAAAGAHLIFCIKDMYADSFEFLPPKNGNRFIEVLGGGTLYTQENASLNNVLQSYQKGSAEFARLKQKYHLYN